MASGKTHRIVVEVEEGTATLPTEPSKATPNTELNPQTNPATQPNTFGGLNMRNIISGAFIGGTVRNAALGTISRIGDYTGNTYFQSRINGTLSLGRYIGSIAIGGAAGIAYALSDVVVKEADFQVQRFKANVRTNFYAEQVGVATYNGSRNRGRKI